MCTVHVCVSANVCSAEEGQFGLLGSGSMRESVCVREGGGGKGGRDMGMGTGLVCKGQIGGGMAQPGESKFPLLRQRAMSGWGSSAEGCRQWHVVLLWV